MAARPLARIAGRLSGTRLRHGRDFGYGESGDSVRRFERCGYWNFLSDKPDYEFADWNFSSTTQEDYEWLYACIAEEGKDVYVADFEELDAYACRILVPGMSEIYPVEDLQWENNSVGNDIRLALVRLIARIVAST